RPGELWRQGLSALADAVDQPPLGIPLTAHPVPGVTTVEGLQHAVRHEMGMNINTPHSTSTIIGLTPRAVVGTWQRSCLPGTSRRQAPSGCPSSINLPCPLVLSAPASQSPPKARLSPPCATCAAPTNGAWRRTLSKLAPAARRRGWETSQPA